MSEIQKYTSEKTRLKSVKNEKLEYEKVLIRKAQEGDKEAKKELFQMHIGFIKKFATELYNHYKQNNSLLDYEEIFSLAVEGFLVSIEKFDLEKDNNLLTYARWWMIQKIQEYIWSSRMIKMPNRSVRIYKILMELLKKQKISLKNMSLKEIKQKIFEYYNIEVEEEDLKNIINWLENQKDIESLDRAINEWEIKLKDIISWPNNLEKEVVNKIFSEQLKEAISEELWSILDDRERQVIMRRFWLDGNEIYTLEEIWKKFNLSRERIRQIEKRAKRKLRRSKKLETLFKDLAGNN